MSTDTKTDGEQRHDLTPVQRVMMEERRQISVTPSGVHPQNVNEMAVLSQTIYRSGLAPAGINNSWEQVFVAIGHAMELGLPILSGIQNIAVINGRASLWGDAVLALCQCSDLFDHSAFEEKIAAEEATCTVRRNLEGAKPVTRTFSIADARVAGLLPAKERSAWSTYPKRMLQMRARMWALRDCFPDLLKGMRSVEEVRDEPQMTIDATEMPQRLPGETKSDHLANVLESRRESPEVTAIRQESPEVAAEQRIAEIIPDAPKTAQDATPAKQAPSATTPTKSAAELKAEAKPEAKKEPPKPKAAPKTAPAPAQQPSQPAKTAEPPKVPTGNSRAIEMFRLQIAKLEPGDDDLVSQTKDQLAWAASKGHLTAEQQTMLAGEIDAKWAVVSGKADPKQGNLIA